MWKGLMTIKVAWCHMGRQTGPPPGEWAWLRVGYETFKNTYLFSCGGEESFEKQRA